MGPRRIGLLLAAAAMSLTGAPRAVDAGEGRWTSRTVTQGGARAGTFHQAEITAPGGYMMIVRCAGPDAFLTVRFGGTEPGWPGSEIGLQANVMRGGRMAVHDLGRLGYSLSAYTAELAPAVAAALRAGDSVTLQGTDFRFDRAFSLAGSSAAMAQLPCL